MRVSELFPIRRWSSGLVVGIVSGHLVIAAGAQSVAQISGASTQQPAAVSQVESFLRDARMASQQGDAKRAAQFLAVADAMARQPGADPALLEQVRQCQAQLEGGGVSADGLTAQRMEPTGPGLQHLLAARRAIASGDVALAQSMLAQAKAAQADFAGMPDDPAAVERLIARQAELVELAGAGRPAEFNAQASAFLLQQASDLLRLGDAQSARSLVVQAKRFPSADLAMADRLIQDCEAKMQTAAQPAGTASGSTADAGSVEAARRLVSMAMLAIDRKDWVQARALVDTAMAMNIPDESFQPGENRPWQLDLMIRKSAPAVAPSAANAPAGQDEGVRNADYDPVRDQARNIQTGMAIPQNAPAPNAPQNAEEISAESQPMDAQQLLFRELQSSVFKERAAAERMMASDPRAALDRMVSVRARIASSDLSPENRSPLLAMIERDIREMQRYIDENLADIVNRETNQDRLETMQLSRERKYEVEKQMQKLVEDFNRMMDQQRYAEADAVARQAWELDPDSEIAVLLREKATMAIRLNEMQSLKSAREEGFWDGMRSAEEAAVPGDSNMPYQHGDAESWNRNSLRRLEAAEMRNFGSEAERQIWNLLRNSRIQGDFRGSLSEVVSQMAAQAGVNIVFDAMALKAENVTTDRLVEVPIMNPISLRSALNIVLGNANLVFVVEDEVIKITSRTVQAKNLVQKHYYVGDLVFPVGIRQNHSQLNFITPSMGMNTQNQLLAVNSGGGGAVNPLVMAQQIPGLGNALGGDMSGMLQDYRNPGGPQAGMPVYTTTGPAPLGGITLQDFQPLINLIQQTIASDSWTGTGNGDGTILPFLPNLSLVVSNTQEVQDQIQDLLTRLRSLNDVQIVVEVRFIILRDTFFERVGVDFDFKLNDNSGFTPGQVQNQDRFPRSIVTGNNGTGAGFIPTNDLDIAFGQNSFASALPQFPSTFDAGSAANFGFAILSDIEVFFLLQATKGDQRSNISQAPVVTMFNGQSASVFDGATRPFVTSVIPVVGDFAVAQMPVISLLPEGTNLNVQAVASNDRRHVTLSLNPYFSQIKEVPNFTFDGTRRVRRSPDNLLRDLAQLLDNDPKNDPLGDDDEFDVETQGVTIQLPVQAFTSVNTVVQVPDNGTVLMGGIKRMNEGRTERGVPFLSNIPYVNRLFKNVGIGRETQNLMMMVTPRIIIQEEQEMFQVGSTGALPGG